MTKIYVPITDEEFVRLSQMAIRDCRHPRDQIRHLIRQALGLVGDDGSSSVQTNNRQAASTLTETSSKAVAVVNA